MKRVVRAGSLEILKIAGDSLPHSTEPSFRELDDVFLQTQTRIWLGEVLHIRFDEETAIADLLANGELLFLVSKTVWKMLLKKHAELKHSKVYIYERTSFGKGDGRYMPYPKVDSFLKICQILGLTGIDLFSPSDVVERRDTRRVCMCIRSLSKKARSKNLNVPDFDIVTYTIAMPTDWVEGIRRNLEQSQYSSSSSNGFSSPSMDSRELYGQESPGGQNPLHYDSHSDSDVADDAESKFTEFEFQSPFDAVDLSNIIGQDSLEGNSIADGEIDTTHNKISIQNGNNELKVEGIGADFAELGQVMGPLRNLDDSIAIDSSSYKSHGYDMGESSAADAEETCGQSSPTIWSKDRENSLPECLLSDNKTSIDHPNEELVMALLGPSTKPETVIYRPEDDAVKCEYMEGSNKENILEIQGIEHENTPSKASEVKAEGNNEKSTITTIQMDDNYSSVDLDQKNMVSTPERKAEDEDEVVQSQSFCSWMSLENKYSSNHCSANTFSFLHVDGTEEELSTSITVISANDQVNPLDNEAVDINEDGDIVEEEKYLLTDSFSTDQIADFDSEVQNISSARTTSSVMSMELSAQVTAEKPVLDTDWYTVCPSDSAFVKNTKAPTHLDSLLNERNQVAPTHLDSLPDSLNMQRASYTDIPTSYYNGQDPIYTSSPTLCCSEDGGTIKERENIDDSTCYLEKLTVDQADDRIMLLMNEGVEVNCSSIGESKMRQSTTSNVSENVTEKLSSDDFFHSEGSSVPQIELPLTDSKETGEQMHLPKGNGISEKEGPFNLKACVDDKIKIHGLKTGGMNSSDGSTDIYCVELRTPKEPEGLEGKLPPKLDPNVKAKEKTRGRKVLKSVVGAMTLLGAVFLVNHVRQKRGKQKDAEPIPPQQIHNPTKENAIPVMREKTRNSSQEHPAERRVDAVKPAVLYPGERLKF